MNLTSPAHLEDTTTHSHVKGAALDPFVQLSIFFIECSAQRRSHTNLYPLCFPSLILE